MVMGIPSRDKIKELYEAKEKIEEELQKVSPIQPHIIDYNDTEYTDVGNAKRFVELHGRNIKYVPLWKSWMVWDGKRWISKAPEQMTPYAEEITKQMRNLAASLPLDQCDKMIKFANSSDSLPRIMATIRLAQNQDGMYSEPDDFDKDKYLINFANGTLDLKTGKIREFNRDDLITKISNVRYDPDAKCPRWLKFLDEIFEEPEMIRYIQSILGMCMTGDASQEQIFVFWGATGGNGKGTLVETVGHILAEYTVALPIASLLSTNKSSIPNDIAMLKGARYCIVNEPKLGIPLDEAKLKLLTGKDSIPARFLNKEFFRFKPTHHTIIQTNPKPNIPANDGGTWRRIVLIPFNITIPVNKRDPKLAEKLQGEVSGILNWLIEGCLRWQREGLIQPPEIVKATEDYRAEMDPLQDFFDNFTVASPAAVTPHKILYTLYKLWCELNEIVPKGSKGFTQLILSKGFKTDRSYDLSGIRCRSFFGISGTLEATKLVIEFLQSGATKDEVMGHLDTLGQGNLVGAGGRVSCARETCVPSVPSVQNPYGDSDNIYNIITLPSVPSVPSVLNKLKDNYDSFNKPDTIQDMLELQQSMELYVLSEIPGSENIDTMKIVKDYCRARGWV